jgi:hypothetical protein
MASTTYKTMDVSDLGDNCTEQELAWFAAACRLRQEDTGESDEQVTEWMWGDGVWPERAGQYVHPDLAGGGWVEVV